MLKLRVIRDACGGGDVASLYVSVKLPFAEFGLIKRLDCLVRIELHGLLGATDMFE